MKKFQLKSNDHDPPKTRTEEPMEIDHIRPQKKCFFCHKGNIYKDTVSLDHLMQ